MNTATLIDVSHTVEHGMVTYKGLPAPIICDYLSREASRARYAAPIPTAPRGGRSPARTARTPFHRYAHGKDLASLPLESLANLDCVVVRIPRNDARAIDRLDLTEKDVRGKAVLVQTGWDRHWRTDQYFERHPHLTGELAEWLVKAGW
jgi:kynurenine formamidase